MEPLILHHFHPFLSADWALLPRLDKPDEARLVDSMAAGKQINGHLVSHARLDEADIVHLVETYGTFIATIFIFPAIMLILTPDWKAGLTIFAVKRSSGASTDAESA